MIKQKWYQNISNSKEKSDDTEDGNKDRLQKKNMVAILIFLIKVLLKIYIIHIL